MARLRRGVGFLLLGATAALAAVWWAPGAAAQSTQGLAITGTVAAATGFTLNATSVNLGSGAPGTAVTSSLSAPFCITVTTNSGTQWNLAMSPSQSTPKFSSASGGSFAANSLRWRFNNPSNPGTFTPLSSSSTLATGTAGRQVCVDFQLAYPGDAPAGDYSATFNIVLN